MTLHHRLCHRHPTKPITGFCPQCLTERLATIDPTTPPPTLRRTKSHSSTTYPDTNHNNNEDDNDNNRRKSCDVGSRNTLSYLFHIEKNHTKNELNQIPPYEPALLKQEVGQIVVDFFEEGSEFKTMREFIDLERDSKNKTTIGASLWETASVFSKKLSKWQQRKQKKSNADLVDIVYKKPNLRRLRETQFEIGRRSCDTDPRLSVDEFRLSFDEPRASWDGYFNEQKTNNPRFTPLVSVIEDVNVNANVKGEETSPGGSEQTRDYYGEALNPQRRRRSFDGGRDVDEGKSISNAAVSPDTVGLFHGAKLLVTEKELRNSNWYSIKDYKAESGESASSKDDGVVADGVSQKGFSFLKSRRWRSVWNVWGLIQKRIGSKFGDDEERYGGDNVVDGAVAESRQKLRRVANGDAGGSGGVSQKLLRSYSVSSRNCYRTDALVQGKNNVETNVDGVKRREELVQQNRSGGYSPNNFDNGLLRFYLTPSRTFKRSKSGKSRLKNVHSIPGSVL
ncbi:DUF740 domain-containing protein [Cephalotus follicularis]|uniref:DUF740 domain-containing protein n=1 Tax=Cephalotus follicularis TaxID=3775 RepID=A0A1Q3C2J3_CEPFO|nr:DUF740 domain-containing protein [Cephalotus follicularis]